MKLSIAGPESQDCAERFARERLLVLRGQLSPAEREELLSFADELAQWPETPGKWMKYYEDTERQERQLCRVENFLPYHDGLRELLTGEGMLSWVSRLLGEPASVFKEKMNLKLPGGSGFTPHQDAPSFARFGRYHVTLLVAIDPFTVENGCLEFSAPVLGDQYLPQADDGTVHPDFADTLQWEPLELSAGDFAFFDSYIPHRSPRNTSSDSRRGLYVTYNRLSDGELRADYFAEKRREFPQECERSAPVSPDSLFNLGNPIR